jgi:pre-rRNA-processing protein TSR1
MPSQPQHHHRSGGLRQTNKKNKRSKASKRSTSRKDGGRVNKNTVAGNSIISQSKADRRNQAVQKRQTKRAEMLRLRRGIGATNHHAPPPTPRVLGIVSLGASADIEERVREFILRDADQVTRNGVSVTCKFNVHKKDGTLTILTAHSAFRQGDSDDAMLLAALDLARISDALLFVIDGNAEKVERDITEMEIGTDAASMNNSSKSIVQDWDHLISERGDRILAALKAQGLPTPVTVLAHTADDDDNFFDDNNTMRSSKSIHKSKIKRHLDLKKYVARFASTEFGDQNKVLEISLTDTSSMEADNIGIDEDNMDSNPRTRKSSSDNFVRAICSMACTPAKWVSNSPRSYILSDSWKYDPSSQELVLVGHIRGKAPWDVNSLVHIPGMGTYACKQVAKASPPLSRKDIMDDEEPVLSEPELRESLDMFATPDSLEGEQNLIGFDEEMDSNEKTAEEAFERPSGWTDYQAAWLDGINDDAIDGYDHGELAEELNRKSGNASIATDGMVMEDDDDANEISRDERRALMEQRKKEQKDDLDFPDEVQIGEDEKAFERFARYRSLKSFRKSYWDPKENLPESYACIFHFASFKQTQRSVMNDMKELIRDADRVGGQFWGKSPNISDGSMDDVSDDEDDDDMLKGCIPTRSYVAMTLEAVPADDVTQVSPNSLLTAVSLLSHENKVSVLHMGLSQSVKCDTTSSDCPVKNKDVLTFRCGWRTWQARPIFSQNNLNCDKHKSERYLPTGGAFFAASIFGPVTYTPCPVLVFRDLEGKKEMVAVGSMIGSDADRIMVKRIILTGYPVRVHKRTATVKYMFYNPEDVKWFKPAGLFTKHGLQGHIIQSVGEHGTMKCLFNAPIKQHDTVCLPLYKRVYPKYAQLQRDGRKSKQESCNEGIPSLVVR